VGNDGAVWMWTTEMDDEGNAYDVLAPFRAYKSLADSVADHDRLLARWPRYRAAFQFHDDPREFARQIMEGGYSTDPDYADKLIALMDRFDLYRFDR
jgi:flagellar protein FlgJ